MAEGTPKGAASSRIIDRIDSLRREGRRRRLFTQLPPLLCGVGAAAAGSVLCGVFFAQRAAERAYSLLLAGLAGMHIGPWLMALSLRPMDSGALMATIGACLVVLIMGTGGSLAVIVRSVRDGVINDVHGSVLTLANALWLAGAGIAAGEWSHSLHAHVRMDEPPQRTVRRLWRGMGIFQLLAACSYTTLAILTLSLPRELRPGAPFDAVDAPLLVALAVGTVVLGRLALWDRLTMRVNELLSRIGEGVSAAAGIAELIGDTLTQKQLLERAVSSFLHPEAADGALDAIGEGGASACAQAERGVPDRVAAPHQARRCSLLPSEHSRHATPRALKARRPSTRQPSEAEAARDAAELLAISEPASFSDVDVFISHSWSDDADAKWVALQAWRARFVAKRGREPRAWFDRLCIPQTEVKATLPCLPLFLAGCNQLLAVHGPTYFSRLWCVLELHIFHQMGGSTNNIRFIRLAPPGPRLSSDWPPPPPPIRAEYEPIEFDARLAETTLAEDKARLLAVIEAGGDGINTFNAWVAERMREAFKSEQAEHLRQTSEDDISLQRSERQAQRRFMPSPPVSPSEKRRQSKRPWIHARLDGSPSTSRSWRSTRDLDACWNATPTSERQQ
ncbi:hypothetical protein KFE25_004943 [Diacronema lutheri]|uniref:TIR domain-containing protein n=1 Tax=Diacronema lutheri TaxID=2081491 RepID=A0A8J6C6C7_DIALT|nr:hypothetical protein KFE25_004943 [Diacronema lutheri]